MEKRTGFRLMVLFLVACILCVAAPAFGMGTNPGLKFERRMVAKAPADECYNGIGQPFKPGPDCAQGEIPKANESYLWGLTKAGNKLWFGTGANMVCLMGAYRKYKAGEEGNAYENGLWVCEYAQGQYLESQTSIEAPPVFNDYRPPSIYTYDLGTQALTHVSAQITDPSVLQLLNGTFGMRSAVTMGDLVFLGGPMALGSGINLFAFNATTGALIGGQNLAQYQNIRKWLVLGNQLYAAVADENDGGRIIKWTGSIAAPFSFVEVGAVDGSATEITTHDGRVFVGTWPNRNEETPALAGIWMSPKVPLSGLTPAHLNAWQKVWSVDDYEPDPVVATTYGCGPLASYGGYLFWGTMHVPFEASNRFSQIYGAGPLEQASGFLKTWRATTFFRGRNFAGAKQVNLLYGEKTLPVYDGANWVDRPNNMGVAPLHGESGFGNFMNNYVWSMAVYENNLFVGTMDQSYLFLDWENLSGNYGENGTYIGIPLIFDILPTPKQEEYGADLWRFPSAGSAAVLVDDGGLGNFTNYGIRTSVVTSSGLYLGTANPTNISMDSDGNRLAGWELHRVYLEK